jgi:uncharacterized protein (DUF2237 family)
MFLTHNKGRRNKISAEKLCFLGEAVYYKPGKKFCICTMEKTDRTEGQE